MVPVEGRGRFRATPAQFGEGDMARCGIVTAAIGVAFGLLTGAPASAWDRGDVDVLAALPAGTPGQPSRLRGRSARPDRALYLARVRLHNTSAPSSHPEL